MLQLTPAPPHIQEESRLSPVGMKRLSGWREWSCRDERCSGEGPWVGAAGVRGAEVMGLGGAGMRGSGVRHRGGATGRRGAGMRTPEEELQG